MPSLDRLVTWWQFTEGRTEAGLAFLIIFVLLLLAGGIFLVVRSVIDLVRNLKSSKRSEDVHKKKAA
jgi:F0F1-type ATP synthase assembly protein I